MTVYNFSSGPSTLPSSVVEIAKQEWHNYQDSGIPLPAMSHRAEAIEALIDDCTQRVRTLLQVPDTHEILWLQGGASLQFAMAPMNLAIPGKPVHVIHTGIWTQKMIAELDGRYDYRVTDSSEADGFTHIPTPTDDAQGASYVSICSNNTIMGTQWNTFPHTAAPLVADMSSDILSRPIDVSAFGCIYAGAQKNLGIAGVTLVIVQRDLCDRCPKSTPPFLRYRTHIEANGHYHTPPSFSMYITNLVLQWIDEQGGVGAIEAANRVKASRLYEHIDASEHLYCPIAPPYRSMMNVVFNATDPSQESAIAKHFEQASLVGLTGHRLRGGFRAALYNAQPLEAVERLIQVSESF